MRCPGVRGYGMSAGKSFRCLVSWSFTFSFLANVNTTPEPSPSSASARSPSSALASRRPFLTAMASAGARWTWPRTGGIYARTREAASIFTATRRHRADHPACETRGRGRAVLPAVRAAGHARAGDRHPGQGHQHHHRSHAGRRPFWNRPRGGAGVRGVRDRPRRVRGPWPPVRLLVAGCTDPGGWAVRPVCGARAWRACSRPAVAVPCRSWLYELVLLGGTLGKLPRCCLCLPVPQAVLAGTEPVAMSRRGAHRRAVWSHPELEGQRPWRLPTPVPPLRGHA